MLSACLFSIPFLLSISRCNTEDSYSIFIYFESCLSAVFEVGEKQYGKQSN